MPRFFNMYLPFDMDIFSRNFKDAARRETNEDVLINYASATAEHAS